MGATTKVEMFTPENPVATTKARIAQGSIKPQANTDQSFETAQNDSVPRLQISKPNPEPVLAKVEEQPERPAWLPAKYKTPEEMAKAHGELEKKLGQPKDGEKPKEGEAEKPKEGEPDKELTQEEKDAKKAEEGAAKITEERMTHYSTEVSKDGKLSDESMAELTKLGIPKAYVDAYVSMFTRDSQYQVQSVVQSIGGDEEFAALSQWAAVNLSAQELDAYNKSLNTTDANQIMFNVKNLHARFRAETGEPTLIEGNNTDESGSDRPFNSVAELKAAQADPRYKNDPAYREAVKNRLVASQVI